MSIDTPPSGDPLIDRLRSDAARFRPRPDPAFRGAVLDAAGRRLPASRVGWAAVAVGLLCLAAWGGFCIVGGSSRPAVAEALPPIDEVAADLPEVDVERWLLAALGLPDTDRLIAEFDAAAVQLAELAANSERPGP
jgi:hypothetical protein